VPAYNRFLARVRPVLSAVLAFGFLPHRDIAQCQPDQRPVTVSDAIEMSEIVPPPVQAGTESESAALFSPDGSRLAVIVKRGDLRTNANVYTLLVFVTQRAFASRQAEAVVRMSSNSNQPAISDLRWLRDNRTLLFLGERPNASAQIYSFSLGAKRLRRLTNHSTSIVSFSASDDGRTIVFEADPFPHDVVQTQEALRNGFIVQGEELTSVLSSGYRSRQSMDFVSRDLFVMSGSHRLQRIELKDGIWPHLSLSVSPDGRYALVEAYAREIPDDWKRYGSGVFQVYVTARKDPAAMSLVETFLLLDTQSGKVSSLLGTPKDWGHDGFLWLDGGRSLIVSRSYLPLAGVSAQEEDARERHPSVVEIELPSRETVQIDTNGLTASSWDETKEELTLVGSQENARVRKVYRRRDSHWVLLSTGDAPARNIHPQVRVAQGMNTPPSLWFSDPSSDRRVMLLDPNPQFSKLCFAEERKFDWKATDGHVVEGGLYLPLGFTAGRRYPLVIQTHAFNPDKFWIDGPWHSAYAAQALAAKGIVVLQMGYDQVGRSTTEEAPRVMAAFDGAIDALSAQGIIDPNRVGILGFSRTVFHAAYALTHSKHHFAAATLVDGVDGGYLQVIAFAAVGAPDAIAVNGGPPWGQNLSGWLERSPLFGVASVDSPIRLEAYGMDSVLGLWGWYALLTRKGMPVEMIVLPDAGHLLAKPWERAVSQQGNVDWFSFWLEGEEDPQSEKAEQYARWRRLRTLLPNASSQAGSPGGD
jgi:dipeptidyl aminopeptidase/acylaminoacyl peptidase